MVLLKSTHVFYMLCSGEEKRKNRQIILVMVSELYIFVLELYLGNNLKL